MHVCVWKEDKGAKYIYLLLTELNPHTTPHHRSVELEWRGDELLLFSALSLYLHHHSSSQSQKEFES